MAAEIAQRAEWRRPEWRVERRGPSAVLSLAGDWIVRGTGLRDAATVREVLTAARGAERLCLEAGGLGRWDSALVAFVLALRDARRSMAEAGLPALDESRLPQPVRRLLALAGEAESGTRPASPARRPVWSLARLGRPALADWDQLVEVSGLVGDVVLHVVSVLTGRLRTRAGEVVRLMADAGASALAIVSLVNALVGGILAFVAAVQLRRFGTQIYVADLVGISMAREMAAITTAIVMAGRTGGAYAAQIATMEGNEEIDALKALGIPVREYLVVPRVVALTTMMPLLYAYACAVGLVGGMVVALSTLDLSTMAYVRETQLAVTRTHLTLGFIKGVTFGAMVALAGCHIGLRAGRSAADVGRAATVAVVVGIIGIIVIDAIFAVCTDALGI